LRVVINQLRKKIEKDPSQPKFILTEPWVGYRFQAPAKPGAGKSAVDAVQKIAKRLGD
jgi:DNA-binding winged helix-turn-helix (wHTH) protein